MKKYVITGLLIWIPLVITLWVLKVIFDALDQSLLLLPESARTENWLGIHIPGLGAILTIAIVLVTGIFAQNFFVMAFKSVFYWPYAGALAVAMTLRWLPAPTPAQVVVGPGREVA